MHAQHKTTATMQHRSLPMNQEFGCMTTCCFELLKHTAGMHAYLLLRTRCAAAAQLPVNASHQFVGMQ
jgi:hypothetical protein